VGMEAQIILLLSGFLFEGVIFLLHFSPFSFIALICISQSLGESQATISRGLVRARLNFICAKFDLKS
jgi:hypothetical protein